MNIIVSQFPFPLIKSHCRGAAKLACVSNYIYTKLLEVITQSF